MSRRPWRTSAFRRVIPHYTARSCISPSAPNVPHRWPSPRPAARAGSCRLTASTASRCNVSAVGIDCPHGVAPGRMPRADATELAPKKSARNHPPVLGSGAGGWFIFRQRPAATKSGGPGLKNANPARPLLPGAPNGFSSMHTGIPVAPARASILSRSLHAGE